MFVHFSTVNVTLILYKLTRYEFYIGISTILLGGGMVRTELKK